MEQFIGEEEVLTVVELENKTPAGNDMVEVCYVNGDKEKMPKARFELVVSSSKVNPGDVLKKLEARVGAILFGTLHEYGIKWGEVNLMSDAMVKLCENGYAKAHDLLWGIPDKAMLSLNMINDILVKDYAKQNNNGSSAAGGGSNQ